MFHWIITLSIMAVFAGLAIFSHSKLGTVRKRDQRPHQLPWGLIMVGCVFAIFLGVVHIMNLLGVETGPDKGPFGRF